MKSETLSLKTIMNEKNWFFYGKQLLFNETLEKKKYIYCCLQKIPDPYNAKKHYQSFIRKKNTNQ